MMNAKFSERAKEFERNLPVINVLSNEKYSEMMLAPLEMYLMGCAIEEDRPYEDYDEKYEKLNNITSLIGGGNDGSRYSFRSSMPPAYSGHHHDHLSALQTGRCQ